MYKATYNNGSLSLKINNVEVSSSNIIDTVKLTYDSGTSELACGVVVIPTLEFTLLNTVSCVLMDTVSLSVGNIPFHSFIVISADKQEYITKFKAYIEPYERLSKGFFGDLEDGYTVHSMLDEISTKTGAVIDGINELPDLPLSRGDVQATGDDGTEQTQKGTNFVGKTYLEQLSLISGLLGKNIIFTRDNHIKFTNLNSTDIVLTDLEKPTMKTNSYRINKIICSTGRDTELVAGSATLSETLSLSNCYMTQEQLNVLLAQFKNITYEAFEFNHAKANLLIEPYDMVSFEYKGQNYVIPVQYLQIVFSSKGANYIVKSFVKQGESTVTEYKGTLTSRVDNVYTEVMQVRKLIANIGQFEEIEVVIAKIDNLYAKVGHIQNLLAGTITSEEINTIHLTSQNAVIDNAIVKSEMIESLAVSKLASGAIDTSKIQINSTNGHMTIADNTIRFIDSKGNTRLYMGEDTNGNFSYQVYDATGNGLLLDENGLKEIAITDGLIKTNMITNQAITGDKINWTSFCESFNSSTNTNTLDSAHITMDGKRLDSVFNQLNTTVRGQTETINTHSSQLTQQANSIQGLVSATTITKQDGTTVGVKDEIANMKLTQDNFQVSISEKVDNIQVGATNLIENSQYNDMSKWTYGSLYTIISAESDYPNNKIAHLKNTDTSKQWQAIYPKNNFLVKTGEVYTFSFDIKAIVVSSDINIRIRYYDSTKDITEKASGNIIGSSDENIKDKVVLNEWVRLSRTVTIPDLTDIQHMAIGIQSTDANEYKTRNWKLEKGNKATDWSPCPEDIATDITNAKNDAISSANSTLTSTISNYYTKTETDSQINATKEEISLKVSSLKTEVMNATYTNLLENSDFLILDGDLPRGYSSYTYGDSSVAISDWVLQGAKAIKISSSGKTDYHWIALFSPFVSTIEGQQFTASAWVATNSYSNVDEGCVIEIEWYGNDGNRISTNAYPFSPKVDTWERVAVTGWSPDGTARARVRISVKQNGELYATRLMFQTGEIATAWTKGGDFENISDRLSYAEQKITDDAITSTVARNFYTKTETENAITSKGYATSSQVQQTANDITFKFSQSGGYNLVRNGNPKPHNYQNWWVSENGWWFLQYFDIGVQTNDTNEAYAGCATFKVFPGATYSFSCWVMAEANTKGVDVYFIGSENDDGAYTEVHHLYYGAGDNLWYQVKRTFTVGSNINYGFIRIDNNGRRDTSSEGSTVVFFSEVQMVKGSECYPQWSPNPNEVYDGIVQIDKNGLKVTSSDFGGYTHITSSGFYLNNGSKDIFSATRDGLKVFSDPNTSINGDVIKSGNIVANNGDLTFNLDSGQMYYKYTRNQVGFLGVTDGNSFFLSTDAKGWCMNSDYGSFSSMGAKSVNGGNYVPYITVTSGGVSNYNAGIFMSMPMTFGRANGVNLVIKDTLELSSKASGAGIFNPKIAWRGTDVVNGAALFPRSNGDRIDIYTTGSSTKSDIFLRLADDANTYFNITCNHYTYGHQSIATFRYVADINGYGIDFYRGLNLHNYNLGNVALKNAKSVQTASLALLDDVATVQTASPTAMRALDNDMEATQATITQHIATSINKTVTFNGTELVENLAEYIELPQDFLMCVDIQVVATPNKLCRFAITNKDEYGFVIETDTEGVTFDYVVIGTKMDGTLFESLHNVEPDTKPVIDEEEEFVKFPNDNLMLPKEFIDKGYTTFADATDEEMIAMKIEQVFGSPVEEEEVTEEDKVVEDEVTEDKEVTEEDKKVTEEDKVTEEEVTEDEVIEETQKDIIIENEDDLNGIDTRTIIENY